MRIRLSSAVALAILAVSSPLAGQARTIHPRVQPFVSVDAPMVALTHVRLIDGTGTPAKSDQTVIIEGERVRAVGPSASTTIPAGARVMELAGFTVIPGLVGLHDHMYYSSAAGGSMQPMFTSYPRLFLANGITTIRTTGSVDAYQELNLKRAIDAGETVGPDVVVTGPYLQGPGTGLSAMHPLSDAENARRMVRYWAEEGVTWFKAYTTITRAELGAAIEEAHKHGVKVTAHLCSVGYREAVALGIDNLEHGLLANSEFYSGKQPDVCPAVPDSVMFGGLDVQGPDVKRTIKEMVDHKVPLTSTLAVFELGSPSRVPVDQRVLDALMPDVSQAIQTWYDRGRTANDASSRGILKTAMQFEREFVKAGGLLAAGSDPCCLSQIAGYGDQRNFELLVEAGFTPEQAIQIMSANGARVLGFDARVGTIAAGMQADLVVLQGDPTMTPSDIRHVQTVFRKGIGYDSGKLIASVKGMVGIK
jgi:imidazolonepropionase-like amidohydrolase